MKPFYIALIAFMFLKSSILVAYAYHIKAYPNLSPDDRVPIYLLTLAAITLSLSLYVKLKMIVQLNLIQCVTLFLIIICVPMVMSKLYWNVLYWRFTYFKWLADFKGMSIIIAMEFITMLTVFAIIKPIRIAKSRSL
jgi:hypothetical protein